LYISLYADDVIVDNRSIVVSVFIVVFASCSYDVGVFIVVHHVGVVADDVVLILLLSLAFLLCMAVLTMVICVMIVYVIVMLLRMRALVVMSSLLPIAFMLFITSVRCC